MAGLLLINPRSGSARPSAEELEREARSRGIDVRLIERGNHPVEVARSADAEALGVAGGDGSLAPIAAVAMERDLPFVCVPFGTRNHFARDLGLDRDDPVAVLEGFEGEERRVDVGMAGELVFLNNISFGVYARLVHRRERHRRRSRAWATAKALWLVARERHPTRITVDGVRMLGRVFLIGNNAYRLEVFELGERRSLTGGRLHLYIAEGALPRTWDERSAERFLVDAPGSHLLGALDGEPIELEPPVEFRIRPRALRVLMPPSAPG